MNHDHSAFDHRKPEMHRYDAHSDSTDFAADLTPELSRELRRVEGLLAQWAAEANASVPAGLSERIFASSRSSLPSSSRDRRLVGSGPVGGIAVHRRTSRGIAWGRLAMAACMAVGFALAGSMLTTRPATPPTISTNSSFIFLPISDRSEIELLLELGDDQAGAILTARDSEYDDLDRELQALNVVLSTRR